MALRLQVTGGVSFQQLDPAASADRYFVRHEGAGPLFIEARNVHGAASWSAANLGGQPNRQLGTANRNRFIMPRPAQPCAIQVRCSSGSESRQVEIWYLACSLVATRSESPALDNPNWHQVLDYLRRTYVGGQIYNFPNLGLIQFRYSDSNGSGVRYGDFVKLVATVSPPNVPLGFFHARRIVSASISAEDANHQPLSDQRGPRVTAPLPGTNDTSFIPSGALTGAGKLFDYDLPGGTMRPFNLPGDSHVWNVVFEQAIGVGLTSQASAWNTLQTNARQLASTRWSVNYRARYNSPAGTPFGEVVLEQRT